MARASVAEIDQYNTLQSTMMARARSNGIKNKTRLCCCRWQSTAKWEYPAGAVVKGDGRVEVISAASIIAKVVRDAEMIELEAKYPGYGFAKNKGYGTAQHLEY